MTAFQETKTKTNTRKLHPLLKYVIGPLDDLLLLPSTLNCESSEVFIIALLLNKNEALP